MLERIILKEKWKCLICNKIFDKYIDARTHEDREECKTKDEPTCNNCDFYSDMYYNEYDELIECNKCLKDNSDVTAYKDLPQPCFVQKFDKFHIGEDWGILQEEE